MRWHIWSRDITLARNAERGLVSGSAVLSQGRMEVKRKAVQIFCWGTTRRKDVRPTEAASEQRARKECYKGGMFDWKYFEY